MKSGTRSIRADLGQSLGQSGSCGRPVDLGHEGAGVVESVGAEVKSVKPGDRVMGCRGSGSAEVSNGG